MRTLNKDEHNYIKQIANIHETLLSQVESNYKCTKLSIALRYEMICSRLEHTNDKIYIYENEERTDKTVYAYKLASQEQGEQITVKTPNKVELDYLQECELVEPDVKMYVQMSGDFGTIAYSWNAEDIKVVGSNSALKQK